MSWNPALDPECPTGDAVDAIDTTIIPRARDFELRRALPARHQQGSCMACAPQDRHRRPGG